MDNVPFHHNKKLLKLIKKSGNMIMYTPKYSPNHNPIENFFSIFKNTYYNINKEKDIPLITRENFVLSINLLCLIDSKKTSIFDVFYLLLYIFNFYILICEKYNISKNIT